jgi:hypothetical protein
MRSHVVPNNQIVRLGLATMVAMTTFVASAKTCKAQSTGEEPRRFELWIENGRLTTLRDPSGAANARSNSFGPPTAGRSPCGYDIEHGRCG